MKRILAGLLLLGMAIGMTFPAHAAAQELDTLVFGNPASEKSHALAADSSQVYTGGLNQTARRLLPLAGQNWQGGDVSFTLKVDPSKPNYFSARFWGSEESPDRLLLFCGGKMVGYIHLGDVDLLDFGDDSGQPPTMGRFYYKTVPLPQSLTHGQTSLQFEIRSIGRIWDYGQTFAVFQKPMVDPTCGIYCAYTGTDGYFVPPADEPEGHIPTDPPIRKSPGPEVLTQLEARVNHTLDGLLSSKKPLNEMEIQFLARAYYVSWTQAYHNPQVVQVVTANLDQLYQRFKQNPKLAQSDPSTPNPGWFGFGPAGDVIMLLSPELQPVLDESISDGAGGTVVRRAAWSAMLQSSRDWHRENRRQYTNQSMIVDLNVYLGNRGIEAIDPAHAIPEATLKQDLYQSLGLIPWLGPVDASGNYTKPLGEDYYELTPHALTKELGFVGYYGEVLDWVTQIYDATRPAPDKPGDPKVLAQLEKITRARSFFRYPALDGDGNKAMRIETIVGWRDDHYPGGVAYVERPSWDGSAVYAAAVTLDPEMVGGVQQMFADNQFFQSVQDQMAQNDGLRVTAGLLDVPQDYALLKAQPASPDRLPMTHGQPDVLFADPGDGVVAIKYGDDILYASLYWRANYAINDLARVHEITPEFDRIAVVRQQEQYTPSGLTYTRPESFGGYLPGGVHYPVQWQSAEAGETLPIAKVPSDEIFKAGDQNVHAGRANFYRLHYGPFLIGMNTTADQTFELTVPAGVRSARDISTGKTVPIKGPLKVGPMDTVVLYIGE